MVKQTSQSSFPSQQSAPTNWGDCPPPLPSSDGLQNEIVIEPSQVHFSLWYRHVRVTQSAQASSQHAAGSAPQQGQSGPQSSLGKSLKLVGGFGVIVPPPIGIQSFGSVVSSSLEGVGGSGEVTVGGS